MRTNEIFTGDYGNLIAINFENYISENYLLDMNHIIKYTFNYRMV